MNAPLARFDAAKRHVNSPSREIRIAACQELSLSPREEDRRLASETRVRIYGGPDAEIVLPDGSTTTLAQCEDDDMDGGPMKWEARLDFALLMVAGVVSLLLLIWAGYEIGRGVMRLYLEAQSLAQIGPEGL